MEPDGSVTSQPTAPVVYNETVYWGDRNGKFYALNLDGTQKWEFDTGTEIYSRPAIYNGVVYVPNTNGDLYALNESDGSEIWSVTKSDRFYYTSPLVANGAVYIGNDNGNLYSLNTSDGTENWAFSAGSYNQVSPAFTNGTIITGNNSGTIYGVDEQGNEVWSYSMPEISFQASPTGYADGWSMTNRRGIVNGNTTPMKI